MAQLAKIDSDVTGLFYAREATLGYLPGENGNAGSPVWYTLQPNSYSDFGGQITTVSPDPINEGRQRKRGSTTGLTAGGGFTQNITFFNMHDLLEGAFFAATRRKPNRICTAVTGTNTFAMATTAGFVAGSIIKGSLFTNAGNNAAFVVSSITANVSATVVGTAAVNETPPADAYVQVVGHQFASGDITVDVTGSLPRIISAAFDLTTLGLVPGQWIYISGDIAATQFANAANNGFKRVRSVTTTQIVLDKSNAAMVADAGAGKTIQIWFGDVLRNETGTGIFRQTFNVERTLGVPDPALPLEMQSEVLKGAVVNNFTLSIPQQSLMTAEVSFVAMDNELREAATGPKRTNPKAPRFAVPINTSSDFSRLRMAPVSSTAVAPSAMFAYVTELTIAIENNVTPATAVSVLGGFDVNVGKFVVTANTTAYFATVAATKAVRDNTDVTLDAIIVKQRQAIAIDIPMVSIGDARPNIEPNQPITLPLSVDAADGEGISPEMNHTILMTFFNWLPATAE